MKKILIVSTSTIHGKPYLSYLFEEMKDFYRGIDEVTFIPFARPGGISHQEYTQKAREAFSKIDIKIKGIDEDNNMKETLKKSKAFFTGGGNTFLLVKQLWELGLMSILKEETEKGKPYMGTSAGCNIIGQTMMTTNDMPIVYPPSFETLGLVPFNINPHYLDPDPSSKHMGETRETRIKEFHTQNHTPVIGLREGSWLRLENDKLELKGDHKTRIFESSKQPYELNSGDVTFLLR